MSRKFVRNKLGHVKCPICGPKSLYYSIHLNCTKCVESMLQLRIDPNMYEYDDYAAIAFSINNIEMFKLLINYCALPFRGDTYDLDRLIHILVRENCETSLKFIIEEGFDVKIKDGKGNFPINYVYIYENTKFLLKNANIIRKNYLLDLITCIDHALLLLTNNSIFLDRRIAKLIIKYITFNVYNRYY